MGSCPACGGRAIGLAQASVECVREFNAAQRAITAAAPRVRRWSWWRFTLLVR